MAHAHGERRRFVQGLIQCAVVLEHVRRGNSRGAPTMLERARPRFDGLPAIYMGIDAAALLAQLEALVAPLRTMPPRAALAVRAGRGRALPVDLNHAPRIELRAEPFAAECAHAVRPEQRRQAPASARHLVAYTRSTLHCQKRSGNTSSASLRSSFVVILTPAQAKSRRRLPLP